MGLVNISIFPNSVRLNYAEKYIQVKLQTFETNIVDIVSNDFDYVMSNYGVVWGFR